MRVLFDAGNMWTFLPMRFRRLMEERFECTWMNFTRVDYGIRAGFAKWADVIFTDWALEWTKFYLEEFPDKRIVVRTHRGDVWHEESPFYQWENADAILFMNNHYRNLFIEQALANALDEDIGKLCITVPRLVDHGRFNFLHDTYQVMSPNRVFGKRLGMCGRVMPRKGNIEIVRLMATELQDFTLSLLGATEGDGKHFEDLEWIEQNKPDNVEVLPETSEGHVVKWFGNTDFIISNSDDESWHAVITEGMLCECVPMVRHWVGAEQMHPKRYIFEDAEDLVRRLKVHTNYAPIDRRELAALSRQWCLARYGLEGVADLYSAIIRGEEVPLDADPKDVLHAWKGV